MATVRSCDRCGTVAPAGGADIRKITVPDGLTPGTRSKDLDLCVATCLPELFKWLGKALEVGTSTPHRSRVERERKLNGGRTERNDDEGDTNGATV
jgi:hypothetical protein